MQEAIRKLTVDKVNRDLEASNDFEEFETTATSNPEAAANAIQEDDDDKITVTNQEYEKPSLLTTDYKLLTYVLSRLTENELHTIRGE